MSLALRVAGLLVLSAVNPAWSQAPAEKEEAPPAPARWTILFRADDPSVWDKDARNAKGEQIANDGYELYRRTENEVGLLYNYDLPNGPDGLTLIYNTPSLIMNLPVAFEIKDIELP